MILIASANSHHAAAWRQVLSPFHRLYEVDIESKHALDVCLKKSSIDVLIVDLALLGEHGVTEIASLKDSLPNLHIIVMTDHPEEREEISAILFGAKAYCGAMRDVRLLPKVVKAVMANELWVDRKFITRLLAEIDDITSARRQETRSLDVGVAKMTPREAQIAENVAKGASNRKIAEDLNISERTVKAHLGVIFRKLGIHDRLQLALYMNRHHQISPIWHSDSHTPAKPRK